MTYYKVLGMEGKSCHGGQGEWRLPTGKRPGKWMPVVKDIELCERGYHLCRRADLVYWLGPEIYEAEGRGGHLVGDDKVVFEQARLTKKLSWDEHKARLFACDCAERVLNIFEKKMVGDSRPRNTIETARRFANGEATKEELDAARDAARGAVGDAAWAAARDAAWDAARDAAGAAAWAAARDAAWAAAGAAAWAAARAAARDAAWAAERKWQTKRLFYYLRLP